MITNTYKILMKTPLGKKSGTLTAERNGSTLNGWLELMRHREPFKGTIDEQGNCSFCGDFITLVRRVSYVATGELRDSYVRLSVAEGRNVFELTGIACPESEE